MVMSCIKTTAKMLGGKGKGRERLYFCLRYTQKTGAKCNTNALVSVLLIQPSSEPILMLFISTVDPRKVGFKKKKAKVGFCFL